MQTTGARSRSTAEARRATVLRRAITVFARTGYHATPVAEVAEAADISTAYVFRLFDGKLGLFVAALEHCYERVVAFATRRSGAAPAAVQRFIARGQLCHLIVAANLADATGPWADTLAAGIRHPGPAPAPAAADGGRGAASD